MEKTDSSRTVIVTYQNNYSCQKKGVLNCKSLFVYCSQVLWGGGGGGGGGRGRWQRKCTQCHYIMFSHLNFDYFP